MYAVALCDRATVAGLLADASDDFDRAPLPFQQSLTYLAIRANAILVGAAALFAGPNGRTLLYAFSARSGQGRPIFKLVAALAEPAHLYLAAVEGSAAAAFWGSMGFVPDHANITTDLLANQIAARDRTGRLAGVGYGKGIAYYTRAPSSVVAARSVADYPDYDPFPASRLMNSGVPPPPPTTSDAHRQYGDKRRRGEDQQATLPDATPARPGDLQPRLSPYHNHAHFP